jgi:hypothetical protein
MLTLTFVLWLGRSVFISRRKRMVSRVPFDISDDLPLSLQ